MTLSLVCCVTNIKNRLAIGKDNDLLFNLKKDLLFFKNLTTNSLSNESKLNFNVVLMGRKTYFSIPQKFRPLTNRLNFVLTNDEQFLKMFPIPKNFSCCKRPIFMTMESFYKIYNKYSPNVFVIGGAKIYNHFLEKKSPSKLYITDVKGYKGNKEDEYIYMNNFDYRYSLVGYSEEFKDVGFNNEKLTYRTLYYNLTNTKTDEFKYLDLAKSILNQGNERVDRTGVGTISKFGEQLRFDISNGTLPLLTTKRVGLKSVIEELLFFCRGDTDTSILSDNGVKIWEGNTSREFLDNRGLSTYKEGIMGNMYGWSWRHFGADYSQRFSDMSKCDRTKIGGFDQLENVERLLKTDPFSRRIYISNLNPLETKNMCLDMCHIYIQFYVTEENGEKYLSSYFTMRSSDYALAAVSFNTMSYALLTYILALRCNMKPKEIIYNSVDCHIYNTHIKGIKEQLSRIPRPFPKIKLSNALVNKDWSQMNYSDFDLIGYFPHSSIKMEMAI